VRNASLRRLRGGIRLTYRIESEGASEKRRLGRDRTRRPLVLPAIGDPALLATGNELEHDFLAAVQARFAVVLVTGEDEPVARHDFIRAPLAQNLVASVLVQLQ
jgi:hypothetical protein